MVAAGLGSGGDVTGGGATTDGSGDDMFGGTSDTAVVGTSDDSTGIVVLDGIVAAADGSGVGVGWSAVVGAGPVSASTDMRYGRPSVPMLTATIATSEIAPTARSPNDHRVPVVGER